VFELANGGTLFFDEIGDLPLDVQGMLLRVLETGVFTPLGGERTIHATFRFVSATHRNLEAMSESGMFRRDLLHRIAEALIVVPPLRERSEDIPILARHFLLEAARTNSVEPAILPEEAANDLQRFPWPGNVRELKNFMRRLAIRNAGHAITVGDCNAETQAAPEPHLEENRILQAVRQSGSIGGAAKILGIHRTTLWRKMCALGLCRPCNSRRSPC
jgi:DNA-binding NtrC family response regulator